MDIHIHQFLINCDVQHTKRILMIHQVRPIGFLDCLGDHIAFHITVIDIIIFKIAISSGNHRLSEKTFDMDALTLLVYGDQI